LRKVSVFAVGTGLLVSLLQAPFAHMHRRDPAHRHAKGFAHAHLPVPAHSGVERPDDASDVQLLDWLALTGDAPASLVMEFCDPVRSPRPHGTHEIVRAPSPRAHDPPSLSQSNPRAPPA